MKFRQCFPPSKNLSGTDASIFFYVMFVICTRCIYYLYIACGFLCLLFDSFLIGMCEKSHSLTFICPGYVNH